jgi:hypothetical protein
LRVLEQTIFESKKAVTENRKWYIMSSFMVSTHLDILLGRLGLRWAYHAASTEETKSHKVLVRKLARKRIYRRPKCKWENSLKLILNT